MGKYFSSTLQHGSQGDEVKEWQKFLQSQGYYNGYSVDGDFGDATFNATKEWQNANGITGSGIVDKDSWGKAGYSDINKFTSAPTISPFPTAPTFDKTGTGLGVFAGAPSAPKFDTTLWGDTERGQAAKGEYDAAKDAVAGFGDFSFSEDAWLDAVKDSIKNYGDFSYDVNEDALYQQLKDNYIQQGKMAMADTMGQAAAMTGGYGSSYAQSVGQQQYHASLEELNDMVPELYKMALDRHNMGKEDLINQYGLLMQEYEREYGAHSDEYERLLTALGLARDDFYDGANLFYTEQGNKNSALQNEFNDKLASWQANTDLAIQKAEWERDAERYANSMLQQEYENKVNAWEAETDNAWKGAQWEETGRQDLLGSMGATEDSVDSLAAASVYNLGGTMNGQVVPEKLMNIPGLTTTNTSYFDADGNFKSATFSRYDEDGNAVWIIDGKEVVRSVETIKDKDGNVTGKIRANPYTGTINSDCKNGTFSNGYQPDNVDGNKLSRTEEKEYVNGVYQTVWVDEKTGILYLWDGTQNKYMEIGQTEATKTEVSRKKSSGLPNR